MLQDYALIRHLSVRQNMEHGLRVRRVAQAERGSAPTKRWPRSVGLDTGPSAAELPGGRRQRVAPAGALVNRPSAGRGLRAALTPPEVRPRSRRPATAPSGDNPAGPDQGPVVDEVASALVVLSALPVWPAQRMSAETYVTPPGRQWPASSQLRPAPTETSSGARSG